MLLIASIVLGMFSCKSDGGKDIEQGEIHYNIEYIGDFGVMKELLPKNMIISFKNDKVLFEMTGLGNSGILNLSNPEEGIYDTYFSLPPVRYFYQGEEGEAYPGFSSMKGMEITKTSKTSVICGLNCKNAEVTFPSDRSKIYNIWYTDEIKAIDTNASTPFSEIDGVLMNFFFIMGSSELHFSAENVYKKELPENTFQRREKYIRVSREDINNLIGKLVSL